MHCQLCLHESPHHAPNCPVATGLPQAGQQMGQYGGLVRVCAVCGGQNGLHIWGGSGGCPGARYDTEAAGSGIQGLQAQALQAQIDELRQRIALLEVQMRPPQR